MIKCKPERDPVQVRNMIIICVVLLVLTAVLACIIQAYKWFFELALIVLVTIVITVVIRYTMSEMEYEVGEGVFTVRKTFNQKTSVVCSLDLSTALSLTPKAEFITKMNDKELPYISTRYNFNQNIRCRAPYVYVCEFNGKNVSVEFEPNALFVSAMLEEIENSKNNKGE